MKLHVLHRTHHRYGAAVHDSFNEARLQPPDTPSQQRHAFLLKVLPSTRLSHYLDFYFNCVHLFEVASPHTELFVEATSTVTTTRPELPALDASVLPLADIEAATRNERCYDFTQPSTFVSGGPDAWRLALDACAGLADAWQVSLALMHHIFRNFVYEPASTHVHTTMPEVLRLRRGVCQDFAHVLLGLCRALKIPARYVSGYLYNGPADQLKGVQASHAWAEVFIPPFGWIGLDPTNDQPADERYVKVATGRDYADVAPLKGTYRGTAERKLSVEVLVTRLDEEPVPAR